MPTYKHACTSIRGRSTPGSPPGRGTAASSRPASLVLSLSTTPCGGEVLCYISCIRCLARNARCSTMLHLTADAVLCTFLARNAWCNTMSHLTAAGGTNHKLRAVNTTVRNMSRWPRPIRTMVSPCFLEVSSRVRSLPWGILGFGLFHSSNTLNHIIIT